jgi:hypothetical protein
LGRNPEEVSRKELFLVYHQKVFLPLLTSSLHQIASPNPSLFDATSVSPVALILFGQSFSEATKGSHRSRVIVNGWIHLEVAELHAAIVRRLQAEINSLLLLKVATPHLEMTRTAELVNAILSRILAHDLCS